MKTKLFILAVGISLAASGVHLASAQVLTLTSAPGLAWSSIACSADGIKVVAVAKDGPIYTSSDAGITWRSNNVPAYGWTAVASSADGNNLVAAASSVEAGMPPIGRPIYTSSDSGATWRSNDVPLADWTSVASSADGSKLVASSRSLGGGDDGSGAIFASTDSGTTWAQITSLSKAWLSVASSADGTRLIAGSTPIWEDGRVIYISTNSGASWVAANISLQANGGALYRVSVASSADGRTLVAATSFNFLGSVGGGIYVSLDYGATWAESAGAPNPYPWGTVTVSAGGEKLITTEWGVIRVSSDWGATWTPVTAPGEWSGTAVSAAGDRAYFATSDRIFTLTPSYSGPWHNASGAYAFVPKITSSDDGTKLALLEERVETDLIYTSSDSGATWLHTSAPSNRWASIASSADGTKLVVNSYASYFGGDGGIYKSADSGANWEKTTAPNNNWASVASSASGTKLVVGSRGDHGGDGHIYTSDDAGATWMRSSAPTNWWSAVVSSADGVKLAAAAVGSGIGPYTFPIYTSTNSGATWNLSASFQCYWVNLAASEDGSKLVAATEEADPTGGGHNPVYTSTDFGVTWATNFPAASPNDWYSVACSINGQIVVLAGDDGILVSTDSGATWMLPRMPYHQLTTAVACSRDGKKIVAAVGNESGAESGAIYTLQLPLPPMPSLPTPKLAIGLSAGNYGISWLVPSTSFVLQENSDLTTTNWTDVTITPTLNFTNLNYQVTVLPTNRQCFYRLKQQGKAYETIL